MIKNKPTDPFLKYLEDQVKHWKDKIEDIEDDELRYQRRRDAAQKQLTFYRLKLKSLADCKSESSKHLETAQQQLASLVTGSNKRP